MVDLKQINDVENEFKDNLRESVIKYEEAKNHIHNGLKTCKYLTNVFKITIVINGLTLIFFSAYSAFILVAGLAALYIGCKTKKTFINAQNFLETEYEMIQNALSDLIDSCELLKDYVRGKKLEDKDLVKIIMFLYTTFGNELDDIIKLLSNNLNTNVALLNEEGNIEKMFDDTSEVNYEFTTESIIPEDENYTRKLKR